MSQITTINPATEEPLASYDLVSETKATQIVEAAHAAFLDWRGKTHEERAEHLTAIAAKPVSYTHLTLPTKRIV